MYLGILATVASKVEYYVMRDMLRKMSLLIQNK
jgi:hypothetical protein